MINQRTPQDPASLSLLTSADAVNAAMDECDQLGTNEFLRKYGFKSARSYLVARNGKLYNSKAIAGVAVGKEHPERGPLVSRDLTGGTSVKAELEALGFEVTGSPLETNLDF